MLPHLWLISDTREDLSLHSKGYAVNRLGFASDIKLPSALTVASFSISASDDPREASPIS